jgi:predicted DNA-binding transcriptional regulator AlpA
MDTNDTTPTPAYVDRPTAAAMMNLSEVTLRRMFAENRGPRVCKMGTARASRVRYAVSEIAAYMADPPGYTQSARPENCPRWEPPSRGNPRHKRERIPGK